MANWSQTFHLFPNLPTEIRLQIWQAAITPRIIRWIRTDDLGEPSSNTFTSSASSLPLFATCREAREACILYGEYTALAGTSRSVYYSPKIDYLFLDARWVKLSVQGLPRGVVKDPLDSLPFALDSVRHLMIHPNYTDDRMKPGLPIERMKSVERILITADEKSIGSHTDLMQASIYDLKKFYEFGQKDRGNLERARMPEIAVGCLGWVGEEKRKLHHGNEDHRELIAVFGGYLEMKKHLNAMREEEVRFLKERFGGTKKTGFILHFKAGKTMESVPPESSPATELMAPEDTTCGGWLSPGENPSQREMSMSRVNTDGQGNMPSEHPGTDHSPGTATLSPPSPDGLPTYLEVMNSS